MKEKNQINSQMMQILNKLKSQARNESGSRHEEERRHHERIYNYKISSHSRRASRTQRHHSPPYSARKFCASKDSRRSLQVSLVRHQRRIYGLDSLQGELKKINPPSFDGEREREDDFEAWFLGIGKYFQLHN